jgi:hypothetical protein
MDDSLILLTIGGALAVAVAFAAWLGVAVILMRLA